MNPTEQLAALTSELAAARAEIAELEQHIERLRGERNIAEKDVARLRTRVFGLEAVHEDASGAVLMERERCAQIVRESWEVHGCCCSDRDALADVIAGGA